MHLLSEYLGWVVAVVGALTTLGIVTLRVRRRTAMVFQKVGQVGDVLLGREAIVHPETGEELAPAVPGIGTRMAVMEQWQAEAGAILVRLAETNSSMAALNARMDLLDTKLDEHLEQHA